MGARRRSTLKLRLSGGAPALVLAVLALDAVAAVAIALATDGPASSDWISFYTGGTLVRTGDGAHLYDTAAQEAVQRGIFGPDARFMGYPLPAFAALLFAPLTALSFDASYWVWFAVNAALAAALLGVAWAHLREAPPSLRALLIVCAATVPVLNVLLLAQVDLLIVASFAASYALLRSGRPLGAGGVLALALFKPHLVAAPVLLLLVTRQWRALAGFAAVAAPLLLLPALALGPGTLADQAALLTSYTSTSSDFQVNAPMMINVRGIVTGVTGSSDVRLWLPPLAIVAAAGLAVAVRTWGARPATDAQSWALAFALPLVYAPHVHVQSLALLAGAAALYVAAVRPGPRLETDANRITIVLVGMVWLWALSLLGVSFMALAVFGAFWACATRWPAAETEAASRASTAAAASLPRPA